MIYYDKSTIANFSTQIAVDNYDVSGTEKILQLNPINNTITYSFNMVYSDDLFSLEEREHIQSAIQLIEKTTGINFEEGPFTDTNSHIEYVHRPGPPQTSSFDHNEDGIPDVKGIFLDPSNMQNILTSDFSYFSRTSIHETLHGLGLAHPGNYEFDQDESLVPNGQYDHSRLSNMSYFSADGGILSSSLRARTKSPLWAC